MIENVDQRSKDYGDVAKAYRPGHADYAYDAKYGFRDYRGGGRSSARETASRVAAGGGRAARHPGSLDPGLCERRSAAMRSTWTSFDADEIGKNPFFSPDSCRSRSAGKLSVDAARKDGSSLGAVVECVATGVPAGWGAPLYAKLDSRTCQCHDEHQRGEGRRDRRRLRGGELAPASRMPIRCGQVKTDPRSFSPIMRAAIAGGISTGQPVRIRVAFKPTSSILIPVDTITREGETSEIVHQGPS
jgi:chorismate synthase